MEIEKVNVPGQPAIPDSVLYKCPRCGNGFNTEEEAVDCANYEPPEAKHDIGDVFRGANYDMDCYQAEYFYITGTKIVESEYNKRCKYRKRVYTINLPSDYSDQVPAEIDCLHLDNQKEIGNVHTPCVRSGEDNLALKKQFEEDAKALESVPDLHNKYSFQVKWNARTGNWYLSVKENK